MSVCPRCSQGMVALNKKMKCPFCGYQYDLPRKMPTYNELMEFIREMGYEHDLELWLEVE